MPNATLDQRKIIHIDMDAFFASVEQRDHPQWRGKPIAVGGDGPRGVITTASYEARPFGVGSAMSGKVAKRKCPNLIFVPIRFEAYRAVSKQIREIFARYTDAIEPLSLDEAFLDVTENKLGEKSAIWVAQLIKADIKKETQLTASAGVAGSKFLAKIASDMQKPDGLTVVLPEDALEFIAKLPVKQFFGVGPKTAAKMEGLGIHTGADLQAWKKEDLIQNFGKSGAWYYDVAHNQDTRPVQPHRVRKSLGVETTFAQDLEDRAELAKALGNLQQNLWQQLSEQERYGRTLTLKVKFSDFKQITRSQSGEIMSGATDFENRVKTLWAAQSFEQPIRLLGLTVSNFDKEGNPKDEDQLSLL